METINDINTNTEEGKMLMAALAKISTESQTNKTPSEILLQVKRLMQAMYENE